MASLNLEGLNPEQRAAVLAPDGPILILAGAGSGKTRAITYRIAHLLGERGADSRELLAVTFTNKAAGEMRDRVAALIDGGEPPWVSTFHSACARILRHEARAAGYQPNFSILDEADSMALIREVIEDAALADSPPPELARARIEQAKNEAIAPAEVAERAEGGRETAIARVYRLYQERLRVINAMDFSDLQFLTYRLFGEHPEILERWQRRATHLLVDEYQDTNRVQYLLVRALSQRSGNICVVGDEDQSIYKWRGANIRNILDFERDFPNARIFKLEQNYRSTKTILAAAGSVIRNNHERKEKTLWTANQGGEKVTYYTGMTERDEADFIAREIAALTQSELRPADVVAFYRVNAQSRVLEEALVRRRVPYYIVGGTRFYERKEVKDLLAYVRVVANPADAIALGRMLGVPPRGIGPRTVAVIKEIAEHEGVTLLESMGRLETASDVALRTAKSAGTLYSWLHDLIDRAPTMSVAGIFDEIITRVGFISYLEGLSDGAERRQNVAELLAGAGAFDAERSGGGLQEYLERIALVSDSDQVASAGGRVALMTLHTSKGLEYPVVFIAGMEEGLFPHQRSQDNGDDIEEERRLCYVGMTRARHLLYLTNTLSRELYGQRTEAHPSRFLAEVDAGLIRRIAPERPKTSFIRTPGPTETYVDYSDSQLPEEELSGDGFGVGAHVMHPTFGRGVIRKREGRGDSAKVWINFDRGGVKLLVLKFAHLRPLVP